MQTMHRASMSAMEGERVVKLEALLTRIRSRTRAPHPPWAILAKDVHRLPAPAPVPVSDVAPTNPRVLAAKPAPSDDEITTEPRHEAKPITAAKLTTTAVQAPRPIEIVPAPPPARPIPRAKTLLMGAAPVAKSPSSFPPPVAPSATPAPIAPAPLPQIATASLHEAPTARRRVDPRLVEPTPTPSPPPQPTPPIETPPIAEEAPVAQHRIVRIASSPPLPPIEAPVFSPASSPAPFLSPALARAPALAPAPAPASIDDLPPLPPAIPIPAAAPARAIAPTPEKQGSKGWWLAIVVFVVFAALLLLAHHYNLLSTRT
jgi:hypothetical protein